jgi:hypothetical protein
MNSISAMPGNIARHPFLIQHQFEFNMLDFPVSVVLLVLHPDTLEEDIAISYL